MGAYEDQPGHVEVTEQEAPPPPVRSDGGTAVPGLDEAPVAEDGADDDDTDDDVDNLD